MAAAADGPLVDRYGRVHRDLRVSLTDRCSLRCTYCMPAEGVPWLANETLLSTDELVRVARVAAGLGIVEVRLT
ncbi:MAG: GTP 3',8-cyclase MoaA, partial [Microbacteriaceae bacterium]|nr:GTP 3',8-cyclase MoaA [Microbacteriaceae bacterium]